MEPTDAMYIRGTITSCRKDGRNGYAFLTGDDGSNVYLPPWLTELMGLRPDSDSDGEVWVVRAVPAARQNGGYYAISAYREDDDEFGQHTHRMLCRFARQLHRLTTKVNGQEEEG